MAGVEFLTDEQPAVEGPVEPPRRRRTPLVRAVVAVVVLGAALTWVLTRPSDAPPRPTVVTPLAAAVPVPVRAHGAGVVSCTLGVPPTRDLVGAIRADLPGVIVRQSTSEECTRVYGLDDDRVLLYEALTVTYRLASVDVEVSVPGTRVPTLSGETRDPGRIALGGAVTRLGSVLVHVVAYGRPGNYAPEREMVELADRLALHPPQLDGVGLHVMDDPVKGHLLH